MTQHLLVISAVTSMLLLSGCSAAHKPASSYSSEASSYEQPYSAFTDDYNAGRAPAELIEFESGDESLGENFSDLEVKAVRQAGRRLGATAGYNQQSDALYDEIAQYSEFLDKIFDFQSLLLPEGIVPPVIAQTDRVIEHTTPQSKTIRARVYKTLVHSKFVNPRPPSWRDYLNLSRTEIERPLPQMQDTIKKHHKVWKQAVQEGWERGHNQARQGFEVAINELERDFLGMQLFHMLWIAEMIEPPRVVEQSENIRGGGQGQDEMSVGVRRIVISEDAYFLNDSSEWNAIISEVQRDYGASSAGLSDVIERVDNTNNIPPAILDNNLRR